MWRGVPDRKPGDGRQEVEKILEDDVQRRKIPGGGGVRTMLFQNLKTRGIIALQVTCVKPKLRAHCST